MPRIALIAAALALLSCAAGPLWSKPGASDETARADFIDCQGQARDATRRDTDIDSDILASRGQDWASAGTLGLHQSVMSSGAADRGDAILGLCMSAKGYALRP